MAEIGYTAIFFTWVAGVYAAVVLLWGKARDNQRMLESGRRAVQAAAFLVTVSVLALLYLLLTHDFRYQYVYDTTSTFQPLVYHISALWQGQEGSILFWLWCLSLLTVLLAWRRSAAHQEMPYALAILGALQAFFALLLMMAANPFALANQIYTEGFGGNPLLENPGMIYHPPTVLAGYAATALPYALFMAALITGKVKDKSWLRGLRSWVILAWLLLTVGIVLGAQWAYVELGWGGYWGWDPVENASLIPWLVNTALLHSLMMQERRGIFKMWNAILVAATFLLCIFATWLTRGGAINSVHAFGTSAIGDIFLLGLIVLTIFSVLVISNGRQLLKGDAEIDGLASREASFLYAILFFSIAAFLVFLGTMFPAISQTIWGRQITWGADSYDRITRFLAPVLLVLLGVCPVLSWRRTRARELARSLVFPLAAALITALLVTLFGTGLTYGVLAFALVSFAGATILNEFYRGWRLRMGKGENALIALWRLILRNRQRYGGYVVHLGVLLMVVGITGQALYHSSQQVALDQGESVTVGPYTLQYVDSGTEESVAKRRFHASLQVYKNGQPVFVLQPERNFHWNVQQWVSEVALHATPAEDLYVILYTIEDNGLATFEVLINPLMSWLWIGGIVLVVGTLLAVWPAQLERPVVRGA